MSLSTVLCLTYPAVLQLHVRTSALNDARVTGQSFETWSTDQQKE